MESCKHDSTLVHEQNNTNYVCIILSSTPLIAQNIRGTKNENIIRNFSDKEIKIYKNRIKIENYHSWIKKFHKIKCLQERNLEYYKGLVLLGVSIIISRRIVKNKR